MMHVVASVNTLLSMPMSAELLQISDGLLTVRLTGKLTQPDLSAVQQQAIRMLPKPSRVRVLVLAETFEGWEKDGDWGDLSFQMEHDQQIEKMAIVANKKWEDLLLMFVGKGIRKFPIEFFPPGQTASAQAWLAGNP